MPFLSGVFSARTFLTPLSSLLTPLSSLLFPPKKKAHRVNDEPCPSMLNDTQLRIPRLFKSRVTPPPCIVVMSVHILLYFNFLFDAAKVHNLFGTTNILPVFFMFYWKKVCFCDNLLSPESPIPTLHLIILITLRGE